MTTTIVITDGNERSALATVRSLGRAGYRVVVTAPRARALAATSRWAAAAHTVPDALADPPAAARAILDTAHREGAALVLPLTDAAMLALAPEQAREPVLLRAIPPADRVARIMDKALVLDEARHLGLAVPRQIVVASAEPEETVGSAGLRFPVACKPARSITLAPGARHRHGVFYGETARSLHDALRALAPAAFPVLVQERIVGPGTGVFLLRWNGRTHAAFAHRRIREKPPTGGVSVARESIALDPTLLERSEALLDRFGWNGVAMVEYKDDWATGRPYLMEINARLWGSLQLALDAGVDFPTLLVRAALGEPLPAPPGPAYRIGVCTRWWWGEVDHVLALFRHRARLLPSDLERLPHPFRALVRLFVWRRHEHEEIFRWQDPMPFVWETVRWFLRT